MNVNSRRQNGPISTFEFCAGCPSHNNCCVRTRHSLGEIASPPLLPAEAKAIADKTGLSVEIFSDGGAHQNQGPSVKRTDTGCYFYKDGSCTIYSFRPFDCKIFPFDIAELGGVLRWIVYLDLCPPDQKFSYRPTDFESAKGFLRDSNVSLEDLKIFVRHGRDVMAPHRYMILEPVVLDT